MYTYIYIEREREKNKERERESAGRGRQGLPETAGEPPCSRPYMYTIYIYIYIFTGAEQPRVGCIGGDGVR